MKIVIKTKNLDLNRELKDYIREKIGSLEKFARVFQSENYYDSFFTKGKPRVEVWVEIGKETQHHRKGPFFHAEAQMRLPGESLRAEAEAENVELAIVEIKDELQRELKKYKEKIGSVTKRRARISKKILRFSSSAKFKRKKGERIKEEGI